MKKQKRRNVSTTFAPVGLDAIALSSFLASHRFQNLHASGAAGACCGQLVLASNDRQNAPVAENKDDDGQSVDKGKAEHHKPLQKHSTLWRISKSFKTKSQFTSLTQNLIKLCLRVGIEHLTCFEQVCDKTTPRNWHVIFLLASNRVEWKQARAIRRTRSLIVVVS